MAKCILHVGMHKTGTTSIQNSLGDLDDPGFYYARLLGRPNHSVTVAAMFARANDPKLKKRRFSKGGRDIKEDVARARRDLASSIEAAGGRTLVISGEGILRMSADDLMRLKSYLERHGYDDIEVIAYIRAPAGYISSAVQQKLKAGSTGVFNLHSSAPDYRSKFEKFDQVFGRGKVRLYKFDPSRFPGGDVVQDFCVKAGIPLSSITLVRKNESITRLAAQLRFQHAVHAEAQGLKTFRAATGAALSGRLNSIDPTRFRLAPNLTRPLVESLAPDIQWMENRLGESLEEELQDHPDDVHGAEDLLRPVPGINEKLRQVLADDGLTVPPEAAEDTIRLVYLVALAAKQGNAGRGARGETAGSASQGARRAMRQERRQAKRAEGAGGARGGKRRAGRGAAREHAEIQARRGRRRIAGAMGPMPGDTAFVPQMAAVPEPAATIPAAPAPAEAAAAPPVPTVALAAAASAVKPAAAELRREARVAQPAIAEERELAAAERSRIQEAPAARAEAVNAAAVRPRPAQNKADGEARLMRQARNMLRKGGNARVVPLTPLTAGPVPLLSREKGLVVLWSPKSACTTTYVWFSNLCGFAGEVRSYAAWPHRHRMEVYMKSDMYIDSASSGMQDAHVLRIIRDPYGRAVSIYRHALQTHFADADMEAFSGGRISAEKGYSFQTFLDLLEQLDMRRVDIHFRPQFHPFERERKPTQVINITKSDLFEGLNAYEQAAGHPKTNFEDLNWLHSLESKRKAKQEPMEGDALDHVSFSRQQVVKLGQFPSYAQLLTPVAKQRIEAIYKADFDAYRDFL